MAKQKKEDSSESNNVSSNFLNSLLKGAEEGTHYNYVECKPVPIDSGSLILSNYVKVKSGSSIRLASETPEAGKTSQAFLYAANFMAVMPKAKTIYIKAEARLTEELQARTGLNFVYSADQWKENTVFVFETNVFELIADTLKGLLKVCHQQGEHLCIIIDSLDGMILQGDLLKDFQSKDCAVVAGVPRLLKLLYRHIGLPVNKYNALLIILSQYSSQIKMNPYAPSEKKVVESSGGNSISFQSDYILNYLPRFKGNLLTEKEGHPDIDKNKVIGLYCDIEIKKSATDNSGYRVSIPIKKGRLGNPLTGQIWTEREVSDLLLSFQLVKKAGAWISFDEEVVKEAKKDGIELRDKVQGVNALFEYLEEDKTVLKYFFDKFKKILAQ